MLNASASILFRKAGLNMVYNDIDKSDYIFEYDKLKFYFSSLFYKEKFIK